MFREPCKGPPTADVRTVGDLATWGVREEAELQSCNAKRAALVEMIDAANPKRGWWGR